MTVIQQAGRFIAVSAFSEKEIVKAAGFRWDRDERHWYTTDQAIADRLSTEGQAAIRAKLAADAATATAAIVESRAASSDIDVPVPDGLAYLPYQRAGISFSLAHESVLFGDEMGLGKTIQAIGTINADASIRKVLIICPASLKLNWRNELRRWLVREMSIGFAAGDQCPVDACDILIVNYDIVSRHAEKLRASAFDMLICDEAHYLKNEKAKRTVAIVGAPAKKAKKRGEEGTPAQPALTARRRIMLTGTPIPNKPIEGWPLFSYLDPQTFNSLFGYAKRYCAGYQGQHGWDFTGASNLGELQDKLRASIMVRRLKKDVLTELPAKRRSVIEIAQNGASAAVAAEQRAYQRHEEEIATLRVAVELAKASDSADEYRDAVERLRAGATAAFTEMSKVRHDTAVAKIPYVIEHLRNAIEDGSKVIAFAHHKDVIEALVAEFGTTAVTVYGETPMAARQAAVERFQSDPTCLVFIGGIQAAGVGLTLTAAAHVVFAELDWVPGNMTQAEDRAHRIGQKEMVIVEHLVLEGSLDASMAKRLISKQEVIDAALDAEASATPVLPDAKDTVATENTTRQQIAKEAPKMTPARIEAVHRGLRKLAAMDTDFARDQNGMGFSSADTIIGHSLAQCVTLTPRQAVLGAKLVNKYRRQLPGELVMAAKA